MSPKSNHLRAWIWIVSRTMACVLALASFSNRSFDTHKGAQSHALHGFDEPFAPEYHQSAEISFCEEDDDDDPPFEHTAQSQTGFEHSPLSGKPTNLRVSPASKRYLLFCRLKVDC